ncbi:hypothetical protein H5410_042979 [Solanum commersonii]|uniref:Uncharacterized protein n=1 Tax=Solanum commersonii TaxID=4109 RepID=A0A9J5XW92_SOLCO|nr:hypothetical protein H5410_042979 [Solanum commersonii]
MWLSTSPTALTVAVSVPSSLTPQDFSWRKFKLKRNVKISRNFEFAISCSGDRAASIGFDVPFPKDYTELLQQVFILFAFSHLKIAGRGRGNGGRDYKALIPLAANSYVTSGNVKLPFVPFMHIMSDYHLSDYVSVKLLHFSRFMSAKEATELALKDNRQLMVSQISLKLNFQLLGWVLYQVMPNCPPYLAVSPDLGM